MTHPHNKPLHTEAEFTNKVDFSTQTFNADTTLYGKWQRSSGPIFQYPNGMAYYDGYFYVADSHNTRKAIFKVDPATGKRTVFSTALTTIPGTGGRQRPQPWGD